MDKFQSALAYITKKVYEPNQLAVTSVREVFKICRNSFSK